MLWFGAIIGILLLLITALAIYLGTRSNEWWNGKLSAQLSESLGREVEILGKFDLDIGRTITLEVSSVRIGNPAWTESPDMLRLGSLFLEFDPLSVFGKAILVQRLDLDNMQLDLVQSQDGKNNWTFGTGTSSSSSKSGNSLALPVGIRQLSIRNTNISLHEAGRKQPLTLQIDTITGSTTANGKAVLDGSGHVNKQALSLHALIEPGESGYIVRPSKVIVGEYRATAEGHISTRDPLRAELDVTAAGPDLSVISVLAGNTQLPAWPFQVKGKIAITNEAITIANAAGSIGKDSIEMNGPIDYSGSMQLNVKASGLSLQALLKGLGYDVIPAPVPYAAEAQIEIAKNQLTITAKRLRLGPTIAVATLNIPDLSSPGLLKIDVSELKTTNIATTLSQLGLEYELSRVMPATVSGQVERSEHATTLSGIRGEIDTASIKVDGTIGDPPRYSNTRLELDIQGSDLEYFTTYPIDQALPFRIKGVVLQEKKHTRFENLQLELANIEARLDGQVGQWESLEDTDLIVSMQATNTDILSAILKRKLPEGVFKFDGHVKASNKAYHVDRMYAELGRNNISGDLKLVQGVPPLLTGKVSSTYLDLAVLQKDIIAEDSSEKAKSQASSDRAVAGKSETPEDDISLLFADTPINLDALDLIDLDMALQVGELTNSVKALGSLYDISAQVLLKGRDLSVTDLEVRGVRNSAVKGNLSIREDAGVTRLEANLEGKQIRLGLGAAPGQDPETYPPIDIDVKLEGAGTTYHNLVTSLNGRIKGVQGKGRVSNSKAMNMFSETFAELFRTLNPFSKTEPTTGLSCAVYLVNLGNAKAEVQDVIIQTDKLTIVSAGIIDLNTEKLNVNFETRPRQGLGISASTITNPYIKLGGSLRDPTIELNSQSALFTTGAAVVTGGLWFVYKGLWDRYFSSDDPCGEALQRDADLQAEKTRKPSTLP